MDFATMQQNYYKHNIRQPLPSKTATEGTPVGQNEQIEVIVLPDPRQRPIPMPIPCGN